MAARRASREENLQVVSALDRLEELGPLTLDQHLQRHEAMKKIYLLDAAEESDWHHTHFR